MDEDDKKGKGKGKRLAAAGEEVEGNIDEKRPAQPECTLISNRSTPTRCDATLKIAQSPQSSSGTSRLITKNSLPPHSSTAALHILIIYHRPFTTCPDWEKMTETSEECTPSVRGERLNASSVTVVICV